ncbi:MAG: LuxR C-terminal-related transcriptional regulator [Nitrososphaerales archaeon]
MPTRTSDFYINLLGQLPGFFNINDMESRVIYSNNRTAKIFGFPSEESLIGITAFDLRCPAVECAAAFVQQDSIVRKTGKALTLLDIHGYTDGTKIFLTKKTPYIVNEKISGSICYATEINTHSLSQICAALIQSDKKYFTHRNNNERSYIIGMNPNEKQLSERETECVFYLLRGMTSKQIGNAIGLSRRTVEAYIENIKIKLNCNKRSEIVEYGLRSGYLNYIPSHLITNNITDIIDGLN